MGTQYFAQPEPGAILHRGPIIQAGVGKPVSPQLESGVEKIEMHGCRALIDTGAGVCLINPGLAAQLDLPVHSMASYTTASGDDIPANVYVGALSFPPPLSVGYDFVQLMEGQRDLENHDIIIGRSILKNWHIVFDFAVGRYSISTM